VYLVFTITSTKRRKDWNC